MSTIDELIATFSPISLEKMDDVTLLNRMDKKFVFNVAKLPVILEQIAPFYHVLEIGQLRNHHYETLYFDTPGYQLYLNHHNKRLNRFKVRSRRYADSGLVYFEIKFKNNKGRTIKERNRQKGPQEEIAGRQEAWLASCTSLTPGMLKPALWVSFSRITLVNCGFTERVTLDTGLSFRNEFGEIAYADVAIAEVKQDRSAGSVIANVLHKEHVLAKKISKYCLGIVSLNHQIRQNNYKEKLHYINKLNHDISEAHYVVPSAIAAGFSGEGSHSAAN